MYTNSSIKRIAAIFSGSRIDLPETPGVYAFWWIGDKKEEILGHIP
jgi:hypothetical protein